MAIKKIIVLFLAVLIIASFFVPVCASEFIANLPEDVLNLLMENVICIAELNADSYSEVLGYASPVYQFPDFDVIFDCTYLILFEDFDSGEMFFYPVDFTYFSESELFLFGLDLSTGEVVVTPGPIGFAVGESDDTFIGLVFPDLGPEFNGACLLTYVEGDFPYFDDSQSALDYVSESISTVTGWIGLFFSSLFARSGSLYPLFVFLLLGISVSALIFVIRAFRVFLWGY